MKEYQIVLDKNSEKLCRDIAKLWNADSQLARIGHFDLEQSKKVVYDISALSQVCLSVITGVTSAVVYDGLKYIISKKIKKSNAEDNNFDIKIIINEKKSIIFINMEPKKSVALNKD